MTTPPPGATLSDDGNYWWDGQAWQLVGTASPPPAVATEEPLTPAVVHGNGEAGLARDGTTPPPGATLSDDGNYWWDGQAWQLVGTASPPPAVATEEPLTPAVVHGNGEAGLARDGITLVVRTRGKHLVTRKESVKDDRRLIQGLSQILVRSRDRQSFAVDLFEERSKAANSFDGCTDKPALDSLLRAIVERAPNVVVELAHPSFGLPDPNVDAMKKARKDAESFNRAEAQARQNSDQQRVHVKTYDKAKDFEKDAPKMSRDGWIPEGQSGGRGGVAVGGTAAKLVLTAGLGAITGFSRKGNKITVTWTKQAPHHEPRPYRAVPDIPEPRVFPHEPYFTATLTEPVSPGHEYPPMAPVVPAEEEANLVPAGNEAEPQLAVVPPPTRSITELLRELTELKNSGLVTDEEFQAKRSELLSRM